jgi:hypothetical protein
MKLPIRLLGLIAAGLLIGSALAPVAAQQQQSGVDGQVAVRSDGAVYLITGGQRRWVAAVQISDADLNAYAEGDPIYAGLGPIGSAGTTASAPAPASSSGSGSSTPKKPDPTASPAAASKPPTSSGAASSAQPAATPDSGASSDIPIELDILESSNNTFQGGDKIGVEIKTTKDNVCELSVKWPNDQEDNEDSKTADSRGRCRFNVDVPDDMKDGTGKLKGWARNAGQYNRVDVDFTIKNKS